MKVDHQIEDELLVLRCRQGDATAMDILLERWQERLWRYALRRTGDEAAAWDVLQEVSLAIARDIRRLETESAFAIWAYRIADNKSRDWIRQHARRRKREALFAEQWLIDREDDPKLHDRISELEEAVPRLPQADQTLLTLRYQNGLSIDELARMLEIPAGTVKSRLFHAKQRLRKLIENRHER